jgi:hypothetical protein
MAKSCAFVKYGGGLPGCLPPHRLRATVCISLRRENPLYFGTLHDQRSSESCVAAPSRRYSSGIYGSADFRHARIAVNTPTFAEKLGTTAHISPLLQKARRLGLDAQGFERLAIQRGCDYYNDGEPLPPAAIDIKQFSNEELAVALLSPLLPPTPRTIRLAAALLGAADMAADEAAALATQEDCAGVVRYIAECGHRFEPENSFWSRLLCLLPEAAMHTDQLPHSTRFVEMTGIDRGRVGLLTRWIRPRRRGAA